MVDCPKHNTTKVLSALCSQKENKKTISSINPISILGYDVGNGCIKPDSDQLRPLLNLPITHNAKTLKGLLTYLHIMLNGSRIFPRRFRILKIQKHFQWINKALPDLKL